jgi:hypothetical protein
MKRPEVNKGTAGQVNTSMLEEQHKNGYDHHPVGKNEFSVWESEQNWGD